MSAPLLVHISDLHCGVHSDMEQVAQLEVFVPELEPTAIIISGDITQRSRHGEYQRALAFVQRLERTAPVIVIPGNHDVAWWASPFGLRGKGPLYAKYRRYFGETLSPVLEVPGAIIASALSSHGVAFGSMTWNLRDTAVKGHVPREEMDRLEETFQNVPADLLRVAVLHHNVLRGEISDRMGLAHWRRAQRWLKECGADVVLCGHDHQEGAGQIDRQTVVSTAGTHTNRTRGKRPSVFNTVTCGPDSITVQHIRWDRDFHKWRHGTQARFARQKRKPIPPDEESAPPQEVLSEEG